MEDMNLVLNPDLKRLQPYPFERLRDLMADTQPDTKRALISMSIGEPQHQTPALIKEALTSSLDQLMNYPATQGTAALRQTIADWLIRRYALSHVDADLQVLPVNGTREALFALAQTIVDRKRHNLPLVVCPNPFYQIYEGAAILAGAEPRFLNTLASEDYRLPLESLSANEWGRVQLMYVCSPGNPTGKVLGIDDWRQIFELSEQHGIVVASDECYSELYFDETKPPLGALEAAQQLGRSYERLVVFGSLSKRSNAPGLRSGFVCGDASILQQFLRYRTYQGGSMSPPVQMASIAAWRDEEHVRHNRSLYKEKFSSMMTELSGAMQARWPDAGIYLWLPTPVSDTLFAQRLLCDYNVAVLPGSFLAREANGINPGAGYVRAALVASHTQCVEAARCMLELLTRL